MFVVSSQWTVVWFLNGVIFYFGGCVNIDNDPRPGRPRPSTDERCIKLVADLKEDRSATIEELSRAMGTKSLQENVQEPTSVALVWATYSS